MVELILWPFFIKSFTGYAFLIYLMFAAFVIPFVLLTAGSLARPGRAKTANQLFSKVFLTTGVVMVIYELSILTGVIPIADLIIIPFLAAGSIFIAVWFNRTKLALPQSAANMLLAGGILLTYFMTLTTLTNWVLDYL